MKPRIIHLIDNLQRGGAEVSLMEILSRIENFEAVVYTLYDRNNGLKDEFIRRGVRVECLGVRPGYLNLFRTKDYLSVLRSESPVLIHSTLFKADIFSRSITPGLRVPLVNSFVNNSYDPRRYASEHRADRMKVRMLQEVDRFTSHAVFRFISNSEAIRDSNCKALGIDLTRAVVIPRGRVVPAWDPPDLDSKKSLQQRFFGRSGLCFMNTGRLIVRKGQGDLLEAFSRVLVRFQDSFLVIAGDGPFRDALERKCSELGLGGNVIFTGTRSDIPDLLRAADFFVFPSWYEGLPGAVLEAMLAGVPVIASDIPENKECSGKEAFYHQVRDPEDLTREILKAVEFPDWPSVTRAAYDRAVQLFDIDSVARRYEGFYHDVLKDWSLRSENDSVR